MNWWLVIISSGSLLLVNVSIIIGYIKNHSNHIHKEIDEIKTDINKIYSKVNENATDIAKIQGRMNNKS